MTNNKQKPIETSITAQATNPLVEIIPYLLNQNVLDAPSLMLLLLTGAKDFISAPNNPGQQRPSYQSIQRPLLWIWLYGRTPLTEPQTLTVFVNLAHTFTDRVLQKPESATPIEHMRLLYTVGMKNIRFAQKIIAHTLSANSPEGKKLILMQIHFIERHYEALSRTEIETAACWKAGLTTESLKTLSTTAHLETSAFDLFRQPENRQPWCRHAWQGGIKLLSLIKNKTFHQLRDNADRIVEIVRGGAFLETADQNGRTALSWINLLSLKHGMQYTNPIKLLLRHGANLAPNTETAEALWRKAVLRNDTEMAKLLLAHGAPPAGTTNECNQTLLHIAVEKGHIEMAEILLGHATPLDQEDINGRTPLHTATVNTNLDMMRLLLKHGAKADRANRHGNTPLHDAARGRSINAATLLLEHGANPNAQDTSGNTPLHESARYARRNVQLCEILLAHGAAPNVTNVSRTTPMDCARNTTHFSENNEEITTLFEEYAEKTSTLRTFGP